MINMRVRNTRSFFSKALQDSFNFEKIKKDQIFKKVVCSILGITVR